MSHLDPVHRHLFLEAIRLRYGYDFRNYCESSLDRRLGTVVSHFNARGVLELIQPIVTSPEMFQQALPLLTINTSEFFRDPTFFRFLRETVLPILRTYPSIRVWSAGCSTGEEVLSLAILLEEEDLLQRTTIYATDISPVILKKAREGIFDLASMQKFVANYSAASGLKTPSDYYTADYGLVRFKPALLERVVFSEHNLVTDSVFVEAHLICCRNVLIYFNRELQDRVLRLFAQSLVHRGFLGIGPKESVRFTPAGEYFEKLHEQENLFQVKGGKL